MAVPKKKTSKSRRNMRRAHHALNPLQVVENPTTGELTLPHHISLDGYYKGRNVLENPHQDNSAEELEETL